jgi:HK97 family phage portal protein
MFDFFKKKVEKSLQLPITALSLSNYAYDSNYTVQVNEGYSYNPIVYSCINRIANCIASIDIKLFEGDNEIEKSPVLDLLNNPSPLKTRDDFINEIILNLLINGNAYIYGKDSEKLPKTLTVIPPDAISLIKGDIFPLEYLIQQKNGSFDVKVNQTTGKSDILHIKLFNPKSKFIGKSPMDACSVSIDIINHGSQWNLGLLKNGTRPDGILTTPPNMSLSAEQREQLKSQIERNSGSKKASKFLLLDNGLDWKALGTNAKDMDFLNSMNKAAKDIALVYGVPPVLLGIQGDSTYANLAEAKLALWTDTILPLFQTVLASLSGFLLPANQYFWYDEEMIIALEPLRSQKAQRIETSTVMTINEKRIAMGLGEVPNGNIILVDSSKLPLDLVGDVGLSEPL